MAAGILADSGPGSAQSSSCPGNTSSSSPLPPPPPRRFLLRPPAGHLRPAPSVPRVRPACGPASLGSPHPGAWLHEAGGAGRAREVPSAPAASGPGEKGSAAFQTSSTESGWEKDVVFLHSSPSWQQAVVGSRSPSYRGVERMVTGTSPRLSPALVQALFKTTSMWMAAVAGRMRRT